MKNLILSLLAIAFFATSQSVWAQQGTIAGKVVDEKGESVPFANLVIEGTSIGSSSDFDGNYRIDVAPGTYTILVSSISYAPKSVPEVKVVEGETTNLDITITSAAQQIDVFEFEEKAVQKSEIAFDKMRQKSTNSIDGMSSEEAKKLGINSSADVMKQVTGTSVEDGGYVVVRGLGDRYSISQLNGVTMPSTDPYRNSTSLDMIPTGMIDNIASFKTFSPDQPGNFTGGNVNITTKSIPDSFYVNATLGLTFNTVSSFNSKFLMDGEQGKTDWLGYDDGTRALSDGLANRSNQELMNSNFYLRARTISESTERETALFQQSADDLSSEFVPREGTSFMDHSVSFAFGNRKKIGENKLGYNLSFRYSRGYAMKENYTLITNEYIGPQVDELKANLNVKGIESNINPRLGGLASVAYQFNGQNEIAVDFLYNHSADYNASLMTGSWSAALSGQHEFFTRNVSLTERELYSFLIRGEHTAKKLNDTKINWVIGRSGGKQDEPDVRLFADYTTFIGNDTNYNISNAEASYPFHFFRTLQDVQHNAQLDIETPFGEEKKHKIKYGGLFQTKSREFDELRFQLADRGADPNGDYLGFTEADGDYDAFYNPSNFGILGTNPNGTQYLLGNSYISQNRPENSYTGTETFFGGYLMGVFEALPTWKVITGARVETTNIEVISGDGSRGEVTGIDVLPSLGIIKAVNERTNVRFNASQTLARPNMRELAPFTSFSLTGGPQYAGNPDLERSKIYNLDLRYEFFPRPGELVSFSLFGKQFENPIMQELKSVGSVYQIEFVNVDNASLYGAEFEFKKKLDFISASLKNFKLGFNFTYTISRVDLSEEEKERNDNLNPDLPDYRPFQAQSPYLANMVFTYTNDSLGWSSSLYSNVYGRRLALNGVIGAPDVYEIQSNSENNIPTPDLNWTITRQFNKRFNATFAVRNILNARFVRNQLFNDTYYTVEAYEIGRSFGITLRYSI